MSMPSLLLSLALPASLAFLSNAHARSVDLVDAPGETKALTEAQACEKQLIDLRRGELTERLQQIHNNEAMIERTLRRLQDSGEIKTEADYDLARAEYTVGPELLSEVLLPEAVYQVFKERYKTKDGIRRALLAFRDISDPVDQGVLVGEVIERLLQFITDVGPDNLSSVPTAAAFLGMNGGQLRGFRDRWMYYESKDQFARILQTGILYTLVSADPGFPERVISRGGPWRWIRRRLGMTKIPARPLALNPKMDLRQIQIEDVEYYDTDELMAFLSRSTTAARRFFVSNRMGYLTREQLERIYDQRGPLRLKKTLVATLESERAWREALRPKWEVLRALDRDRTELKSRIKRLEDAHVYDQRQVFEDLDVMFREQNADIVADKANTLMKDQVDRCDEVRFARLVGKIIDNGGSRMKGSPELALRFLEGAVDNANAFNLTEDQLKKVQLDLTRLASSLSFTVQKRGRALVQKLVSSRPKFENLDLPSLKTRLAQTEIDRDAAKRDLDEVYARH